MIYNFDLTELWVLTIGLYGKHLEIELTHKPCNTWTPIFGPSMSIYTNYTNQYYCYACKERLLEPLIKTANGCVQACRLAHSI